MTADGAAAAAAAASSSAEERTAAETSAFASASDEEPLPSPPVAEVLRRVFARDHPGVGAMCSWLEEEGVHTAAQLGALLAPPQSAHEQRKGGAAALRELGFRAEWAAAVAAGFARAAAAAAAAAPR